MTKKKDYGETLLEDAKSTVKLGMLTGLGTYAFGRVGAAHPTVRPVTGAVTTSLQLAQVGKLAQTGMRVANVPTGESKKKKSGNSVVDNILG